MHPFMHIRSTYVTWWCFYNKTTLWFLVELKFVCFCFVLLFVKNVFVFAELRERHQLELQNLTLTTQPFRTLQLFIFSTLIHLKRSFLYVLMKGSRFMLLSMLIVGFIVLFMTTNGSREKVFAFLFLKLFFW